MTKGRLYVWRCTRTEERGVRDLWPITRTTTADIYIYIYRWGGETKRALSLSFSKSVGAINYTYIVYNIPCLFSRTLHFLTASSELFYDNARYIILLRFRRYISGGRVILCYCVRRLSFKWHILYRRRSRCCHLVCWSSWKKFETNKKPPRFFGTVVVRSATFIALVTVLKLLFAASRHFWKTDGTVSEQSERP